MLLIIPPGGASTSGVTDLNGLTGSIILAAGTNITLTPVGNTITIAASGGGHVIEDEGVALTQRATLNFVGAGVTATDDAGNDATKVTIPLTSPGGADTQVQFNDGGAFGGDAGLTWNKTTDTLTITGGGLSVATGTITALERGLQVTQTWNNGAVTFEGVAISITKTAAFADSVAFYVEVDGKSGIEVSPDTAAGGVGVRLLSEMVGIDGDQHPINGGALAIGSGIQNNPGFPSTIVAVLGQSMAAAATTGTGMLLAVDTGPGTANASTLTGHRISLDQSRTAGTLTTAVPLKIDTVRKDGGGAIGTVAAIDIEDQTNGATNYALRSRAGLVQLGTLTASKPVFTDASKNLVSTGTLGADQGGTGLTSYAVGDLLYASGATTLSKLADVAAGSYLRSGGVTTAPVWSTVTLPNAATVGDILSVSAANVYANIAAVAQGQRLVSKGTATLPAWIQLQTVAWAVMTSSTITNIPVALTEYQPGLRTKFDFTEFTQVRLLGNVTVAGNSGSKFRCQYSTDGGSSWNYFDSTGANANPSLTLTTTGIKDSGWITIDTAAKADVLMRVVVLDGDAAADPVVFNAVLYAR